MTDTTPADLPPAPAECCTELGFEDQTDSADGEVLQFITSAVAAVIALLSFCYLMAEGGLL